MTAPRINRPKFPIFAAASNNRDGSLVSTLISTARQSVNAAADLVPATVPRPLAQGGVAIAGVFLLLTIFKSLISTAFSVVALGAIAYFAWVALNDKGNGGDAGGGGGGNNNLDDSDPLNEARRIMDKYK
eukprot:jgi/Mesvir1/21268/Mv21669-RA.1